MSGPKADSEPEGCLWLCLIICKVMQQQKQKTFFESDRALCLAGHSFRKLCLPLWESVVQELVFRVSVFEGIRFWAPPPFQESTTCLWAQKHCANSNRKVCQRSSVFRSFERGVSSTTTCIAWFRRTSTSCVARKEPVGPSDTSASRTKPSLVVNAEHTLPPVTSLRQFCPDCHEELTEDQHRGEG